MLSPFLTLFPTLYLTMSHALSLPLSPTLSLTLSLTLSPTVFHSPCFSPCLPLCFAMFPISVSCPVSHPVAHSTSPFVLSCLSLSVFLCLPLWLPLCFSVCLSLFHAASLCRSFRLSLCLSPCLSLASYHVSPSVSSSASHADFHSVAHSVAHILSPCVTHSVSPFSLTMSLTMSLSLCPPVSLYILYIYNLPLSPTLPLLLSLHLPSLPFFAFLSVFVLCLISSSRLSSALSLDVFDKTDKRSKQKTAWSNRIGSLPPILSGLVCFMNDVRFPRTLHAYCLGDPLLAGMLFRSRITSNLYVHVRLTVKRYRYLRLLLHWRRWEWLFTRAGGRQDKVGAVDLYINKYA